MSIDALKVEVFTIVIINCNNNNGMIIKKQAAQPPLNGVSDCLNCNNYTNALV